MKAQAFEGGYVARLPIGGALDVLAPNRILEEKFREGWRACEIKRRGMREPSDLHRVGVMVSGVRALAKVAFVGVGRLGACSLFFALSTDRALDDDGFIFLVKPVIDGMVDAGCCSKDRRQFISISGSVVREEEPVDERGDVLAVRVVLP